jgi:ABC-type spermidine/putrescine transport system permease subunit II
MNAVNNSHFIVTVFMWNAQFTDIPIAMYKNIFFSVIERIQVNSTSSSSNNNNNNNN